MSDAKTRSVRRQTDRTAFTTATMQLPPWPRPHVHPKPAEVSAGEGPEPAAADKTEREDAVMQLSGALRTAERAHRAYLAELRVGDVDPAEDWSTWYAEYLVGLR